MLPASAALFERHSIHLTIRSAVAFRECPERNSVVVYLSLFDDEIDLRAERFFKALRTNSPESAARYLELTDAACGLSGDGEFWVARGGSATVPLYWRDDGSSLSITTRLPTDETRTLSVSGLLASTAVACMNSSYEANGFTQTPVAGWHRVRRAAVVRFRDHGQQAETPIAATNEHMRVPDRAQVCREIASAFQAYAESQRQVRTSLLEVSGGIDSTLSATALHSHDMHGVSVAFPYYEFRFEAGVQQAVADTLGISREEIDGTDLFPYSDPDAPLVLDEPTVFATGMRHSTVVARRAAALGAQRIYMGHGGDQCFATDLTVPEPLVSNPPSRGPFNRRSWRVVEEAIRNIRLSAYTHRALGTFVYDARQDIWVKELFGPVIRTPFTDLAIFRSAQSWSRHCCAKGVRPDKSILAEALPGLLPDAVLNRKGKVAYDGVWMRAYSAQEARLCSVFERSAAVLEHIGISPGWLLARTRALAAWQECSDREVLAAYALCVWLQAQGIFAPDEVRWGP